MTNEIITLESITKYYFFKNRALRERIPIFNFLSQEKFYALKNISFSINEGESVGIIGKNGSGKTILLKIISGIVYPTSGKIVVKKPISPIFEFGAGFHPELSGLENIFLYGSLLGIKKEKIQKNLGDIISFSELGSFLNLRAKYYSTGMLTRLAFSVASILSPEVLILDEALSVGDQYFVKKVHYKIFELQEQRVTMLITSHHLELLKYFCKKGIVLDKGEIIFSGEINGALDCYQNLELSSSTKKSLVSV